MSEYQYYEFQAIDRPLSDADRQALRALSTRARITATSFTNEYHWGDFRGNPVQLMERWFDLHLYTANWGTKRLMIRLPQRLVARSRLDRFLRCVDLVRIRESGENLIVVVHQDHQDDQPYFTYDEDDSDHLAAMAPLRADVLAGDWRLFYLLWLTAVESGRLQDADTEPLPGIGPLTGALKAFADFFAINPDLVQAAAESPLYANGGLPAAQVRAVVAAIPDTEKTALLCRLAAGEPHVAAELMCKVRAAAATASDADTGHRTVVDLRTRAAEIRKQVEAAEAARLEEERRARLAVVRRQGAAVWRKINGEIEKRNARGYDRALELLLDLRELAQEDGALAAFSERVHALQKRHYRKLRFIERLHQLGQQ